MPTTVEALRLNRSGVVNLRRLLRSANLHPPKNVEGDEQGLSSRRKRSSHLGVV
ncbi:hypothetical protein [Scytonema sp. NUACC21]